MNSLLVFAVHFLFFTNVLFDTNIGEMLEPPPPSIPAATAQSTPSHVPDTPTPTSTPTLTLTLTPTLSNTPVITPSPTSVSTVSVTLSTATNTPTQTPIPTLSPTDTPVRTLSEFVTEMNTYRNQNNRGSLSESSVLCSVASKRVAELVQRGELDHHEGYAKYSDELKNSFSGWGEILHSSSPQWTTADIIQNGWKASPSHNAQMLDESYTFGCGATDGNFAVFEFGK